jgi:hypothetical protein
LDLQEWLVRQVLWGQRVLKGSLGRLGRQELLGRLARPELQGQQALLVRRVRLGRLVFQELRGLSGPLERLELWVRRVRR